MDTVFGILFLCLGTVASIGSAINTWRALCAESWPVATGKITLSRTRETRRKNRIILVADIGYTYNVGDATLRGSTVRYLQPECLSEMGVSVTQKYPVDREVEVRYMPQNHDVSCLEVGLYPISWVAIPIGVTVMALGAYLIQK
jgi:hypothetical protein